MSFFNQYPYININDLNLDFILKAIREMRYEVTNFVSINAIKYADPIQWNITSQYEKNTIVIDPVTGTAYISVAPVPAGVALTREEYWTVVFDLGSFVTRAAQNFTSHWESETTLTATFATPAGGWLVWGDVLYKALTNITAGDSYVVGGNIEHFTIEELYNAYLNTIEEIRETIGNLDNLTTSNKDDIVSAINEVVDNLGDLSNLTTSDKSNVVSAINEIDEDLGDLSDLTTDDKTSAVNAINELNGLRPYLSSFWTQVWIDSANGDDDNDGLTAGAPLKTVAALVDKYINPKRDAGGLLTSFRINFANADTYDIDSFQGVSNVQIHFYNVSAGTVTLKLGTPYQLRNYNSYIHFNGTASAPIIFDINGDYTFGGDNNAYWFDYTTIVNSGAAVTNFFQYALGCEITFQHSIIDNVGITLLFRDSNVWCTGTNIKALMQAISGDVTFNDGNTTNSIQLNECECNIIGTHYIDLDLSMRNYAFSCNGCRFNVNVGATINVNTKNSSATPVIPIFAGYGNIYNVPASAVFSVGTLSSRFSSYIYGSDNIINVDVPANVLTFCDDIFVNVATKENVVKNVYGAFRKDYYGDSKTLADLNGVHFDKYFTGHFLSVNIQGNNYVLDITNANNRLTGVAQVGTMGQFAYFHLNITLTNTPSGGCTINVGSNSRIFNYDVTAGTCTSTTDLTGLNLFEVNMF